MASHTLLLSFHILMGALSIISGFTSLLTRKGSAIHLRGGKVFLINMTFMCLSGALLSILGGITISLLVSIFTLYLVSTAWRASVRFKQTTGWLDVAGFTVTTALSVSFFYHGHLAQISPTGTIDDIPIGATPYYVFAFISLFSAFRDLSFILQTKRTRKQAQPSHIWRISLALFIATSSFFTGNPQVFPDWFNQSFISSLPERVVMLVMIYYLFSRFLSKPIKKMGSSFVLHLKGDQQHNEQRNPKPT